MKTYEDVTEEMETHFQKPETDTEDSDTSSSSLSSSSSKKSVNDTESSSSDSSEEISLSSDEMTEILSGYLSHNKLYLKKYEKSLIEKIINTKYSSSNKYLLNILNSSDGYQGCSDISNILDCLEKYPDVVSIQLDDNEITLIDEKLSDLDYGTYCPCIIEIKPEDLETFIFNKDGSSIKDKIHKNVPITRNKFRAYYGNLCNQSLSSGIDLENVLSIYMYPSNDPEDVKRVAVCQNYTIDKSSRNKIIDYKDIYFLGGGDNFQQIKNFFTKGNWLPEETQNLKKMGGKRRNKYTKKYKKYIKKTKKNI